MVREKEASRTGIVICQATFDSLWVYHQKFQIMPMPVGLKELKSAALSGPGYAMQHCSIWSELAASLSSCTFS